MGRSVAVTADCLICNGSPSRYTKPVSFEKLSSSSSLLSKQLNIIFILRSLLELPPERLQLYLKCVGDPGEWGLWLCGRCWGDVREAVTLHQELVRVERKLRVVKKTIVGRIKESSCEDEGGAGRRMFDEGNGWITEFSRDFVQTRYYDQLENPFVSGDARAKSKRFRAGDKDKPRSGFKVEVEEANYGQDDDDDPLLDESTSQSSFLALGDDDHHDDDGGSLPLDSFHNEDDDDEEIGLGSEAVSKEEQELQEGVHYLKTKKGKYFKCLKCTWISSKMSQLLFHVKLHKSSPHKCKTCNRVYPSIRTLRTHEGRNKCRSFKPVNSVKVITDSVTTNSLIIGSSKHSGTFAKSKGKYKECTVCELSMPARRLPAHQKLWHDNDDSSSSKKGLERTTTTEYVLPESSNMEEGGANDAEVTYPCPKCSRVFRKVELLDGHLHLHKTSPFHCHICLQVFHTESRMTSHLSVSHSSEENNVVDDKSLRGRVKCKICSRTFPPDKMREHEELHETSPYSCESCGRVFAQQTYLRNHLVKYQRQLFVEMKRINPRDPLSASVDLTKFYFPVCSNIPASVKREKQATRNDRIRKLRLQRFLKKSKIANQVKVERKPRLVTNKGNIRCEKCPGCFPPDEMEAHLKLHETRPYTCIGCGKVYAREKSLRCHLRVLHRRLYHEMKRINPTAPLTVKIDPTEFIVGDDDVDIPFEEAEAEGLVGCPLCKKFFFTPETSEELCAHLEECVAELPDTAREFECPLCRDFKCFTGEIAEFGEHLLNCNNDEEEEQIPLTKRIFKCNLCPKNYLRLEKYIEHYQDHAIKQYMCIRCPLRFVHPSDINNHWRNVHSSPSDVVTVVAGGRTQRKREDSSNRSQRVISVPDVSWWCPKCNEKFTGEEKRDAHMESSHPSRNSDGEEKPHVCPTCQKVYACLDELNFHMGLTHIMENFRLLDLYRCDLCEELRGYKNDLDRQKRSKHRVNLFVCETCGFECAALGTLRVHRQTHKESKRFKCETCPQSFAILEQLRNHKYIEHTPHDSKVNPLVCKYCNRIFKQRFYLAKHIAQVHEGKHKVVCHLCGYGAMSQSVINRHLLVKHKMGELKKHPCPVEGCGRKLKTPKELKDHLFMHEGTPQYFCGHCGKGFYSKSDMKRHEEIHTNAETKPFECQICSKRFPVRGYLRIHMKSHNK